jgi:DNA gyrase inhibitor GyrI
LKADDPKEVQLETGIIPGGWYARRKVENWEKAVEEGELPSMFEELARSNFDNLDGSRPSIEFYRSHYELLLMVPVLGPPPSRLD